MQPDSAKPRRHLSAYYQSSAGDGAFYEEAQHFLTRLRRLAS